MAPDDAPVGHLRFPIRRDRSLAERTTLGMLRNTFRGILALILTAVATWLANRIADKVFGPEDAPSSAR
jgi:hypothetical protein